VFECPIHPPSPHRGAALHGTAGCRAPDFAKQALIAIENTRLFEAEPARTKELRESLEYQAAISDVLIVISHSRNNLQPVLDEIAAANSNRESL
jgi:hypothetical protein